MAGQAAEVGQAVVVDGQAAVAVGPAAVAVGPAVDGQAAVDGAVVVRFCLNLFLSN